jgi:hypothetical protein
VLLTFGGRSARAAAAPAPDFQPPSDEHAARPAGPRRQPRRPADIGSPAQLGEIDVEHHHDEQEQHRDRADIDDDQDHRQELGAQQHEQAGGVEEGQDQEQHRMHRDCAT